MPQKVEEMQDTKMKQPVEQNHYSNYLDMMEDYTDKTVSDEPPKHKYTITLHRAMFTAELYELYRKYE